MLLVDKQSGDLVRVDDLDILFNPYASDVIGRDQAGEEEQDPASYRKEQLTFPSGEALPLCWLNPDYRTLRSSPSKLKHGVGKVR